MVSQITWIIFGEDSAGWQFVIYLLPARVLVSQLLNSEGSSRDESSTLAPAASIVLVCCRGPQIRRTDAQFNSFWDSIIGVLSTMDNIIGTWNHGTWITLLEHFSNQERKFGLLKYSTSHIRLLNMGKKTHSYKSANESTKHRYSDKVTRQVN